MRGSWSRCGAERPHQDALTEDINECLDIDAYKTEVEQEDKDAFAIQARKAVVMEYLRTLPDE